MNRHIKQPFSNVFFAFLLLIGLGLITGSVVGQRPMSDWFRTVRSGNSDRYDAVELAGHGDVYAAGFHESNADLDPGPDTILATNRGMFVQKFNAMGDLLWVYSVTGNLNQGQHGIRDIIVDGDSNLLVVGRTGGGVDFDPGPGTAVLPVVAPADMFLLKISPAGNLIFAKIVGSGGGGENPYSVGVDSLNNIVIAGQFQGGMDFDPGPGSLIIGANYYDAFILKYDLNGVPLWGKAFGGSYIDAVTAMKVAPNGIITVAGKYANTCDFDPGIGLATHTAVGVYDGFLAQYSASGSFSWVKVFTTFGSSSTSIPTTLAADGAGNFVVAGNFDGSLDLDPGAATHNVNSAGTGDVFMVKTNNVGDFLWGYRIGGQASQSMAMATFDSLGDVYFAGTTIGQVDFNPSMSVHYVYSGGNSDLFVTKFSASGQFQWVGTIGGQGSNSFYQIAVEAPDQLFGVGQFYGTFDFAMGPPVLNHPSLWDDGFIVHLIPCVVKYGYVSDTACNYYALNGQTFTSSGTYTQTLRSLQGCDSILTIDLTLMPVNATATSTPQGLAASPLGMSYQWLFCTTGNLPVPGATSSLFVPTWPFSYQVVVDYGYCLDTSDCVPWTPVGISTQGKEWLTLHPNPTSELVQLTLHGQPQSTMKAQIADLSGKTFKSFDAMLDVQGQYTIDVQVDELPSGLYVLKVQSEDRFAVRMFTKQ
jgi:hypothetical protein